MSGENVLYCVFSTNSENYLPHHTSRIMTLLFTNQIQQSHFTFHGAFSSILIFFYHFAKHYRSLRYFSHRFYGTVRVKTNIVRNFKNMQLKYLIGNGNPIWERKIAEKKTIISEYHLTKRTCENANTSTKCKYKIWNLKNRNTYPPYCFGLMLKVETATLLAGFDSRRCYWTKLGYFLVRISTVNGATMFHSK